MRILFGRMLLALIVFGAPAAAEPSRVLIIDLPQLVQERYDAQAVLHLRDGAFHHGYALLAGRDNLVHRVDLTPSPAVRFELDGEPVDVPKGMRGNYSYKNKEFGKWKGLYNSGKLRITHPDPIRPLAIDDGRLTGDLDLLFHEPDEANTAGRNNFDLVYRLKIDAKAQGDGFAGTARVWQYREREDSYGADSPKRDLAISAAWADDHWQPTSGTAIAAGKDWPMAHGLYLTASAAPHDGPLIHNLHDARLVWVAEDTLPSGRSGGRTRGDFAMFPFAWTTHGYGGYGAPIVADGKVFVYVHATDLDAVMAEPDTADNPYYRLGLDPRGLDENHKRDAVFAFDAQTGAKLWQFLGNTGGLSRNSKGGMASTPCFLDGKLYVRGQSGLYCLDANTGEKLWQKGGEKEVGGFGIHSAPHDGSVVMLGQTLILVNRGFRENPATTIGIDPADGSVRWHHKGVGPTSIGLPGRYVHDGKAYAVLARPLPDKRAEPGPDTFVMIDPADGRIVWESHSLRATGAQILVWNDIAVGNTTPMADLLQIKKNRNDATRLGAVRLSPDGAEPMWASPKLDWIGSRTINVINDGILYTNTRTKGFNAVDLKTGEHLGKHPHIYHMTQGSHNWTWHVATNDRVLISGVAMFTTGDKGFELLPGRLSLDITGGYSAPTKPAIADGRLFMRLADKLVCYDLRALEDDNTQVIELVAEGALVGVAPTRSADVPIRIRERGGQLLSVGGKVGRIGADEQWAVVNWAGSWAGNLPWRSTVPHDLELTDAALVGPITLRLGWQYEPWELALERDGDRFTGTYKRIAPPLKQPIEVEGQVSGKLVAQPGGTRRFELSLQKGIGGRSQLIAGTAEENLLVVIVCKGDTVSHAWAACGRLNRVLHEIDPAGLTIDGNAVTGSMTLVTHDDEYQDVHFERSVEEFRNAGEGPALAATYQLEIEANDAGAVAGTHTGTLGVAWEKTGTINGSIKPDVAP